jgi:hypothetical protein
MILVIIVGILEDCENSILSILTIIASIRKAKHLIGFPKGWLCVPG